MASVRFYKLGLLIGLGIGFVFSFIILAYNTNIFWVNDGTTAIRHIDMQEVLGDEIGAGYVQLDRNPNSPSFLELVEFSNGMQYSYFTIEEDERLKKELIVDIPKGLESGDYYVDYSILINGKSFTDTLKITVR